MANFWDLPKPVREQIYRLHLVQEDPVDIDNFQAACGVDLSPTWDWGSLRRKSRRGKPRLLDLCKKTEREAAAIYFSENTFVCRLPYEVHSWRARIWPRHLGLIRSLAINGWTDPEKYGGSYNECFRLLASFKGLKVLILKVDEQISLERKLERHSTIKWHHSLGCGPQLQLQVLHFCGIHGLKSLTKIPRIEFPPLTEEGGKSHGDSGAIVGGVLDTLIRREIARSPRYRPYKRKGHFRFLELPPEIRNIIYTMLLVFSGVTYPKIDTPTSVASQSPYLRDVDKDDIPVPPSALSILQTNRQIHNEAVGMFYRQNDLVFSYPSHLQDFLQSLERDRLESVSSLTLFHKNHNEGGISTMATTLKLLRRLRGLKKFHLLVKQHLVGNLWWSPTQLKKRCVTRIQGIAVLFTLRGVAEIKVRDLDLEDRLNEAGKHGTSQGDNKVIEDLVQILKHFNHGLALAQTGVVVKELCDEFWWSHDEWPSLGESACGKSVGCVFGNSGEDADKEQSTSD